MTREHAWKLVRPDGRTRNDFVWPLTVGAEAVSNHDLRPDVGLQDDIGACPRREGDGLTVGLSARGLASAGFSSPTLLAVSFDTSAVLNRGNSKIRVGGPVRVEAVIDWWRALREGAWRLLGDTAYLRRAYLRGAYLRDAHLGGADLRGAYLRGADLRRAYLGDADLRDANLRDAYLRGADLRDADLRDADLRDANLRDAYLRGADLRGAYLGGWERGPDGYARKVGT